MSARPACCLLQHPRAELEKIANARPTPNLHTQHDFAAADKTIREDMLPAAARLCTGLNATLTEAATVLACCRARHVSRLGRMVTMVVVAVIAFAAVFAAAIGGVVISGRRRRNLEDLLRLPTSGLGGYGGGSYTKPGGGLGGGRGGSWAL